MKPIKYQEFHANGQLWIDGQIIVVTEKGLPFGGKFQNKIIN
jgi:hypothetical protein